MKKIVLAVVSLVLVVFAALAFNKGSSNSEFLRVHIRANSNDNIDQTVKYAVKNAVVEYLTPFVAKANTKEQAMKIVSENLDGVCKVADKVLKDNGFSYASTASVCAEEFPTRTYDGVTLDSGLYDALIINLGEGEGNNWWCVVYPPLCFTGGESNGTNSITYKSKILEIIQNWLNK